MATRKRKGNLLKKLNIKSESSDEEIDATAISDEEINVKDDDPDEEWDEHNESSEGQANTSFEDETEDKEGASPQGTMFLDVLAQVASDRLEIDPGPSSQSSAPKKATNMSKRSLLNMDFLHLDQIRTLSPKFLVNLFAEMNSNEITRNYSYTCYIIPEKCNSTYSSFGSEIRARDLIKSHLQKHVEDLVKLKAANQGFSFIAETVVAKKKREIAEKSMRKRKAWNVGVNKISKKAPLKLPSKGKPAANPKKLTGIKPLKGRKSSSDEVHVNVSIVKKPRDVNSSPAGTQSQSSEGDFPMILHDNEFTIPIKAHAVDEESGEEPSEFTVEHSKADGEWDIIEDKAKVPFKRTGRNVERNEKIIWDILCASQPYHDHSYTTVFGKRKAGQAFEDMDMLEMDEEVDEEDRQASRTGGLKCALPSQMELEPSTENANPVVMKIADKVENKLHVPMVRIEYSGGNEGSALISPEIMGHTVNRPYPPMPKSDLAHQGRIPMMEEPVSSSEDEPLTAVTPTTTASSIVSPSKKRYRRKVAEGTLEWEKRLALKCIRELRSRKKEENNGLICKICKDKTFTATATLMYHYRSHAGIKPFVCLICNTTFTRQHSLNYHMLIHNNQSRFTCVDCGRKFRHPSHFKEHLRRHTGETPFHCMDCPLRFKTRNTYKRHLRTRHGKLLTANGIRILPEDEFLKIRSRYAKKGVNEEDEEFDEEEEDETTIQTKLPQSQNQDDDIDPDAEIDLEGLDSDKESKIDDNVQSKDTPISVQSTLQQITQQQIIHQQANQPSAIYVPISQGSTVGVPIAISTMARNISAIAVPIQVSASSLSTVAFPIKMPLDQNLATVAVPVNVPADQNLSALSDTSASTKLLQLCSQVVQQEVG